MCTHVSKWVLLIIKDVIPEIECEKQDPGFKAFWDKIDPQKQTLHKPIWFDRNSESQKSERPERLF